MSSIEKKQFYNGQSVSKDDMNAILDYTSHNIEQILSIHLGFGVISGFNLSNEGGFALGVSAGLAYANDGKKLVLESGKQIDLTNLAPNVGTKTVLVGMTQDFNPSNPATDNEGNLVYTTLSETVKFVHGESLPSNTLALASVELSSSGILIINNIAPVLETSKSTSNRTKGLFSRNQSLVFSREDGFECDLVHGIWRKPVFNPQKSDGYSKDDIIWLLPPDYRTLWTPPSTEVTYPWTMPADHPYNLLGKEKTYLAQTSFTLQAIRLRSTKDNNTDNPITNKSCIGSSWVVDEPRALCEESNCTYNNVNVDSVRFAGGGMEHYAKQFTLVRTPSGGASNGTFTFPMPFKVLTNLEAWKGVNNAGAGAYDRSTVFVQSYATGLTSAIIASSATVSGSDDYMTRVSVRATGTWY
ncbi:MAG: hypothetical protein ACRC9L_02115 [Brevinema sp.]